MQLKGSQFWVERLASSYIYIQFSQRNKTEVELILFESVLKYYSTANNVATRRNVRWTFVIYPQNKQPKNGAELENFPGIFQPVKKIRMGNPRKYFNKNKTVKTIILLNKHKNTHITGVGPFRKANLWMLTSPENSQTRKFIQSNWHPNLEKWKENRAHKTKP